MTDADDDDQFCEKAADSNYSALNERIFIAHDAHSAAVTVTSINHLFDFLQ